MRKKTVFILNVFLECPNQLTIRTKKTNSAKYPDPRSTYTKIFPITLKKN